MAYMFKQYMRLIAKWPRDNFKGGERNLIYFMERELEHIFKMSNELPDTALCDKRLKGSFFNS